VTVVDTSAIVDLVLGIGVAAQVSDLIEAEGELAAPDVIVFETLAVLRRETLRGALLERRAAAAVDDLGDVPLALFGSLTVRARAWELRSNLTAADALFVSLAEALGEPLATKDRALATAAAAHTAVEVLTLP
jgi:predicted nucleic acid-binding protein